MTGERGKLGGRVIPSAAAACLLCGLGRKGGMTAGETHQAIEATFRIERARLIAAWRMVRNVDRAEELAQDALVIAPARMAEDRRSSQSRRLADDGRQTRAPSTRLSPLTRCAQWKAHRRR